MAATKTFPFSTHIRRDGDRSDIYSLAKKLFRLHPLGQED